MSEYVQREYSNNQRDLVLASNEYCFLQNKTNGVIKTYTGPVTMTISAQEALVIFDEKTKQFKETSDFSIAKKLFVSPPENWYAILKNPTKTGEHPELGKASSTTELVIGRKINIPGPISFSLYPGQMAKVVKGHTLRTNQYLLARVYDAEVANNTNDNGKVIAADGQETKIDEKYITGQILVIKGTEVSFYIPPTGIEVISTDDYDKEYVRDAITLERLEYCILKDEDGNKRYVHGPEVVFPKSTETFVSNVKGGYIFRAIELSKISGIYVKVIAEYTENGVTHPVGEELFITGDTQMIYYPRPEHAIINYDNKILHHAIAIPKGEGRYVMNRLTGEIETKVGPLMYLPDPRTEVVVKRKLTRNQCHLWYPGNKEVLEYNDLLNEKAVEKSVAKGLNTSYLNAMNCSLTNAVTMDTFETNASISRGTSYTKPRTITLDNKFDGVVSLDIWTGYAVNVISKNGERKVVCGPQTVLLDYDQTLEVLNLSTGRPKTTDCLESTVYLRHENNKISDLIKVETKDFVEAEIKISYCVDFLLEYQDRWFSIENYVKYLCDRQRSLIKREVKKYTIEELYQNYNDIIRNIAIDYNEETENNEQSSRKSGRFFSENGMIVHDAEILSIHISNSVKEIIDAHQYDMLEKSLELTASEKTTSIVKQLSENKKAQRAMRYEENLHKMELQREEAIKRLEIQSEIARKDEAEKQASKMAEKDMQTMIDAIAEAKRIRKEKDDEAEIQYQNKLAEIEAAKQKAYAETVEQIVKAISPDLVAALSTKANAELLSEASKNLSPYAIARGESVADTINTLMRGTTLENVIDKIANKENY